MLVVDGRDDSVDRMRACLAEVGYSDVKIDYVSGRLVAYYMCGANRYSDARRAVWRAFTLVFPSTYVCWGCYETNGAQPGHDHCGTCRCCQPKDDT